MTHNIKNGEYKYIKEINLDADGPVVTRRMG